MSANYYSHDPHGRPDNRYDGSDIPDYHPQNQSKDQGSFASQYSRQPPAQHYVPQRSTHDSYGSSIYDIDQSSIRSSIPAPRSHFSRSIEHHDPRQAGPPRRPARPDAHHVDHTPSPQERRHQIYQQFFEDRSHSQHGNGQWTSNGYTLPGAQSTTDLNQFSHPPNNLQALISQMRNRAPLGPPPSARRGPSSYYSDTHSVHPIVEETASLKGSGNHRPSQSIDSNDGRHLAAPSSFYPSERSSAYSEVPALPEPALFKRRNEDDPQASSDGRDPESTTESAANAHVRQASLGLKTRPILTTVKSSDRMRDNLSTPASSDREMPTRREFPMAGVGEREKTITPSQSSLSLRDPSSHQHSPAASRRGGPYNQSPGNSSEALGSTTDVSSSDAEYVEKERAKRSHLLAAPFQSRSKSPLVPKEFLDAKGPSVLDKEVRSNSNESDTLPRSGNGFAKPPSRKLADRVGSKKPAHINMAAVREAEGRGSLTSLPELISRATRLASNLDRGKTASRLGMSAWLGGSSGSDDRMQKHRSSAGQSHRSGGSLSDMLASFPPPAIGTPTGPQHGSISQYSQSVYSKHDNPKHQHGTHGPQRNFGGWSSNLRHSVKLRSNSDLVDEKYHRTDQRRCCGMPLWLFILLIILGICLVAAAIIIPVVVVVIPEQQRNAASAANSTSSCVQNYPCQNGGSTIVANDGSCRCICTNGYSGASCTDAKQNDCSTITIDGTNNATVGSSVPRIINAAKSRYEIPLDASKLVGLFSSASLNCANENTLITFNNLSKRDLDQPELFVRMPQAAATSTAAAAAAATSNGIVFQEGSPTASSATSAPAATSTNSPSSSAGSSGTFTANGTTIDFARTAVLYILQSSGQLPQAVTAQQALQNFFSTSSSLQASAGMASSIALGNGASANLLTYRVQLAVGAAVGGGSGAAP